MIHILSATPCDYIKWQISLYQHFYKTIYGNYENNLVLIGHQNGYHDPYYESFEEIGWDFLKMDYKMVDSIRAPESSDEYKVEHLLSANVFYNIKSIKDTLLDSEVYCIYDCDMMPIRRYKGIMPTDDTVVCFDFYENWHMKIQNPWKENFKYISEYITHDTFKYMNGGFVPIMITGKNLKLILDDVIDISISIIKDCKFEQFGWWATMAGFQVACHNHKLKCVSDDTTYIPGMNQFDYKTMFAHYSVSPDMPKNDVDNWDVDSFKSDFFWDEVKNWWKTEWKKIK